MEGISIVRQSVFCLGFHFDWTPAVFIRTISNGLSLGSDLWFSNGNWILVLVLKDSDRFLRILDLQVFLVLDQLKYPSISTSKVTDRAAENNRTITLFLGYGFYLVTRRITRESRDANKKGWIEILPRVKSNIL